MKIVGIVGSNADFSYNRLLLNKIATDFKKAIDVEVLEIKDVPVFNKTDDQTDSEPIQFLTKKIEAADGVIIATPEYNYSVPSALQSVIEWLSYRVHPFKDKPVMIMGASIDEGGPSQALLHLQQILSAPDVRALVMPEHPFQLGQVDQLFDDNHDLIDAKTIDLLKRSVGKFIHYVQSLEQDQSNTRVEDPLELEDIYATGSIDTTIEGLDMLADDWVEQAAEITNAVDGNTYVKLNRGILTVDQLNYFLNSMPLELTYADSNNQFLYYNYTKEAEDMLADRTPSQVGCPLANGHSERAHQGIAWVVQQLRTGKQDVIRVPVPTNDPDKFVVHSYKAMRDDDGNYAGINEYVQDLQPTIDWYLEQTGQELTRGNVDATSGATNKVDTTSSATTKD